MFELVSQASSVTVTVPHPFVPSTEHTAGSAWSVIPNTTRELFLLWNFYLVLYLLLLLFIFEIIIEHHFPLLSPPF